MTNKPLLPLAASLALALGCSAAFAKDLGTQGTVFPIVERDMRQQVMESAARVDWEKEGKRVAESGKRYLDELPSRQRPEPAETKLTWVDPSITLESDIQVPVKQQDGSWKWQMLYRKGHKHNPLDAAVPMTAMLFINSADPEQMKLAKDLLAIEPWRIQVVEAGAGNVRIGAESLGRPLFYGNDQLLTRFQIHKLPSLLFANERLQRGRMGVLELAKPFDLSATRAWEGLAPAFQKDLNEAPR